MSNNILDFTIDELRVVVGKDYRLFFDSPIGVEPPHMPTISAEGIVELQSKISDILQCKMLHDFANETDEQKQVKKDNAMKYLIKQ